MKRRPPIEEEFRIFRHLWRIIAKALGEKAHHRNELADQVAFVRFLILLSYMFTNLCIVLNTWRHWND